MLILQYVESSCECSGCTSTPSVITGGSCASNADCVSGACDTSSSPSCTCASPSLSPTSSPSNAPSAAPTAAAVVSSAVVLAGLDVEAFNSDAAAQSAVAASLVASIPSLSSTDQVSNLVAQLYLSRRSSQTTVSFDLTLAPASGQSSSQMRADLVSELTAAVSNDALGNALAANTPANSALSSASVSKDASNSQIAAATVVVTQSPTTSAPTRSTPSTATPTTAGPTAVPLFSQVTVTCSVTFVNGQLFNEPQFNHGGVLQVTRANSIHC